MDVVYIVLGLLLMLVGIGVAAWFGYQNRELREAMSQVTDHSEELRQAEAIRRNVQRICDRRSEEVRRLRETVQHNEDHIHDLENQINQLNLKLFHESGRRILAEKDEGAHRMHMELADRQLTETQRKLRQAEDNARATETQLRANIAELEDELDRLRKGRQRRTGRRSAETPELERQVTLDEVLRQAGE